MAGHIPSSSTQAWSTPFIQSVLGELQLVAAALTKQSSGSRPIARGTKANRTQRKTMGIWLRTTRSGLT